MPFKMAQAEGPPRARAHRPARGCHGHLQVRIRRQGRKGEDFRRIRGPRRRYRLAGGVEADPGLVGQPGDPLGSQHDRELTKHAG
jgi:hypothetical protein